MSFPWLTVLWLAPLAGALLVLAVPARAREFGIGAALGVLGVSVAVAAQFDSGASGYQLVESQEWIPALGAGYTLGIDGVALVLVLLMHRQQRMREETEALSRQALQRAGLCILTLLAYALLFEPLGFVLSTALATFVLGLLFTGRVLPCLISGVLMGVLLYALFDYALDVPLPLGVFEALVES